MTFFEEAPDKPESRLDKVLDSIYLNCLCFVIFLLGAAFWADGYRRIIDVILLVSVTSRLTYKIMIGKGPYYKIRRVLRGY